MRHWTLLLLIYVPINVHAGTDERVLACRTIGDTAARLRCYDEVADAMVPAADAPRAASQVPPQTASGPTTAEAATVAPAPVSAQVPVTDQPTQAQTPTPTPTPDDDQGITPEERFGLSSEASRRKAGLEFEDKDLDLIEATITAIGRTGYDKFVVRLDNGQKWRQMDTKKLRLRPGDAVRISSAMFGSFLLEKSTGSRMIRVQRIE